MQGFIQSIVNGAGFGLGFIFVAAAMKAILHVGIC